MLLVFDTETSGLGPKANLVQLAAMLVEDNGTVRGSCDLIVKPDGYEIPEEASAIHGITTEMALQYGVPLAVAVAVFNNFAMQCSEGILVAHNLSFDMRIIHAAYERGGWPSRIDSMKKFCTMENTVDLVRMPPTEKMLKYGIKKHKSPKLSEAYEFAFKKPMVGAHNALYDVMACKDLYFWILQNQSK